MTASTLAAAVERVAIVWRDRTASLLETLQRWPYLDTVITLRRRFREDRLGVTAGGLTFTTLMSLVPLVTVMLAALAAFPMFSLLHDAVQKYFLQSLIPEIIARPVLAALAQFSSKASRLGIVGLVALAGSTLAMLLTVDRTLNGIWRVRRPRPIAQRVLVYWAAITLGPLLLGLSLSLTSYLISASRGLVGALPGGVGFLLGSVEFLLMVAGVAGLFHYVPNTDVRWRHAIAGAVFVAAGLEVVKRLLAWYLVRVPTYAMVYGAFATLPILLVWIYVSWVIVLLGAVIAAYAPSLQMRVTRWPDGAGSRFELALSVLRELRRAQTAGGNGLSIAELAAALRIDPLQADPILEALVGLDWIGRLDEATSARYVLLRDPAATPIEPLVSLLLLQPTSASRAFRQRARFTEMTLQDAIVS